MLLLTSFGGDNVYDSVAVLGDHVAVLSNGVAMRGGIDVWGDVAVRGFMGEGSALLG